MGRLSFFFYFMSVFVCLLLMLSDILCLFSMIFSLLMRNVSSCMLLCGSFVNIECFVLLL